MSKDFTFKFVPATDETVDPQYELYSPDGKETRIAIQDCRSYGCGYAVNEYSGEGDDFGVTFLGTTKTLMLAKEIALVRYFNTHADLRSA